MKNCKCFYESGLNFKCKEGCVDCCANESGFVFLSSRDIEHIAKATALTIQQAIEVYTRVFVSDSKERFRVLKEYSNNKCIFLTDKGCSIYPDRPIQCSTYPFWPRVLASMATWCAEEVMCPGINDKSQLISKSDIETQLALFKENL